MGWKKLASGIIARLVIPHDAQRLNSYSSRKCRASKVFVHEMWNADGTVFNGTAVDSHSGKLKYTTGQEVFPDKFNDDKCLECTSGIHFFMTREEATAY